MKQRGFPSGTSSFSCPLKRNSFAMTPVSPSDARTLIHTRRIECLGWQRQDGMWDIEAHLSDIKTYSFANHDRGQIAAGEPVHDMVIQLTVDENLLIHKATATTRNAPFRECPDIAPAYSQLEGLTIGKGFESRVRSLFRGPSGCTHLRELLRPLATTAIQTIMPLRAAQQQEQNAGNTTPQALLDTCYALRPEGDVAAREWPGLHKPHEAS